MLWEALRFLLDLYTAVDWYKVGILIKMKGKIILNYEGFERL